MALTIIVWRLPADSWIQNVDDQWRARVISVRSASGTSAARFLSVVGGWPWNYAVLVIAAGALAVRRRIADALFVVSAVLLTTIVVVPALKLAVGRPRPPAHLVDVVGYSFPSGHAAFAAATAATLAIVATRHRRWWLALAVVVTVAMMISRTYLSVHWLSDTVAGALTGSTVALLGAALLHTWCGDRCRQNDTDPRTIERWKL